jgi:deoxyribodipyrimidine photo-lyase
MKPERVRLFKIGSKRDAPILYWMSRDQRIRDNWALAFAQSLAVKDSVPLAVAFTLAPSFLGATRRQYLFMLRGLEELSASLDPFGIPFYLLKGEPAATMVAFAEEHRVGCIVTDFDPLKEKNDWKGQVMRSVDAHVYEVDAHNVVPCWAASTKQEYGAHTFRPKLHRYLPVYFEEYPDLAPHPIPWRGEPDGFSVEGTMGWLKPDAAGEEVGWIHPGETAAMAALQSFIGTRLSSYGLNRNNIMEAGQSDLSPYLHFGQLSAQRVALSIIGCQCNKPSADTFLEELLVRRELSDNYCLYNANYDSFLGFPQWSRKTLDDHRGDRREHAYTLREFDAAKTHDPLWNAAQREMRGRGKMHGHMRMYWAKKILEWSESPEEAVRFAIQLNDRYELDGRDPNGYAGVAWSIGGTHDRAWKERAIFGKVRYMGRKGMDSKFDTAGYIARYGSP